MNGLNNKKTKHKQYRFVSMGSTNQVPKEGSLWRHYKGHIYVVRGLCTLKTSLSSRESGELCVLYNRLSKPMRYDWLRPFNAWYTMKSYEGKELPRFSAVVDGSNEADFECEKDTKELRAQHDVFAKDSYPVGELWQDCDGLRYRLMQYCVDEDYLKIHAVMRSLSQMISSCVAVPYLNMKNELRRIEEVEETDKDTSLM